MVHHTVIIRSIEIWLITFIYTAEKDMDFAGTSHSTNKSRLLFWREKLHRLHSTHPEFYADFFSFPQLAFFASVLVGFIFGKPNWVYRFVSVLNVSISNYPYTRSKISIDSLHKVYILPVVTTLKQFTYIGSTLKQCIQNNDSLIYAINI